MSHLWNKNLTNVDSEYFCFPKTNLCLFKQLIFLLDNLLYKAIQLCYREEIFNEENKQKKELAFSHFDYVPKSYFLNQITWITFWLS